LIHLHLILSDLIIEYIFVLFQCVGHISGAYINPAITIAALILGKKSLIMAGFYIIAQCLGALLGFGLLKVNEYTYIHLFTDYKNHNYVSAKIFEQSYFGGNKLLIMFVFIYITRYQKLRYLKAANIIFLSIQTSACS